MKLFGLTSHLSPDLLRPKFRGSWNPLHGHCYVASEAAYHILGTQSGWKPMFMHHEGTPHWFLSAEVSGYTGERWTLDLTLRQFQNPPDHRNGVSKGFLTREPSSRARELISRFDAKARTVREGQVWVYQRLLPTPLKPMIHRVASFDGVFGQSLSRPMDSSSSTSSICTLTLASAAYMILGGDTWGTWDLMTEDSLAALEVIAS